MEYVAFYRFIPKPTIDPILSGRKKKPSILCLWNMKKAFENIGFSTVVSVDFTIGSRSFISTVGYWWQTSDNGKKAYPLMTSFHARNDWILIVCRMYCMYNTFIRSKIVNDISGLRRQQVSYDRMGRYALTTNVSEECVLRPQETTVRTRWASAGRISAKNCFNKKKKCSIIYVGHETIETCIPSKDASPGLTHFANLMTFIRYCYYKSMQC